MVYPGSFRRVCARMDTGAWRGLQSGSNRVLQLVQIGAGLANINRGGRFELKIKIAPDVFAALNYRLHRRLKTIARTAGLFLDTSRRQKINCDNPETKSASLADSSSI